MIRGDFAPYGIRNRLRIEKIEIEICAGSLSLLPINKFHLQCRIVGRFQKFEPR